MLTKPLDWGIREGIGYLVLNQPPANTMTLFFFEELDALTKKIKATGDLKGIIITGKGRHFSSGADLNELTESIKNELRKNKFIHSTDFMQRNLENFQFINDLRIPVVAAIKGVCIGSAFELALFCHFRLCATNAVVGLPESTFGLIPGLGGIQKILDQTSKVLAMEMVFKGNTFNANESLKTGIIDRIMAKDQVMVSARILIEISGANYRKYNKNEYLHQLDKHLILSE